MTGRAYHYHGPHARAAEAGITAADVPTGSDDDDGWSAYLAAQGDPWRMVACGVCGRMVPAPEVAGHVVACASAEVT